MTKQTSRQSTPVVVGLGEVLWDLFPDERRFGGAPANFACHANALGADALVASAVGRDELGQQAVAFLAQRNVGTQYIEQSERLPTGVVNIQIDGNGIPTYEFPSQSAWDAINWSPALQALAEQANVVCFGTLAQRSEYSRRTLRRFLRTTQPQCIRLFDINLRKNFYSDVLIVESLEAANVLKLNDEELMVVSRVLGLDQAQPPAILLANIAERFDLRLVALTRGSEGSMLYREGQIHEQPVMPTEIVDTVGAGDSFAATLAIGMWKEKTLAEINLRAASVAAFICSQVGATSKLPAELVQW